MVFLSGFLRQGFSNCPSCPGIYFVDKAALSLTEIILPVSPVLGLHVCANMPGSILYCF